MNMIGPLDLDPLSVRTNLDGDALADLQDAIAVRERVVAEAAACLYSISGTLYGQKIERALVAGECILVHGPSPEACDKMAQEGLHDSIALAQQERSVLILPNAGIEAEMGGRRVRENPRPLDNDFMVFLENRFGRKPKR